MKTTSNLFLLVVFVIVNMDIVLWHHLHLFDVGTWIQLYNECLSHYSWEKAE